MQTSKHMTTRRARNLHRLNFTEVFTSQKDNGEVVKMRVQKSGYMSFRKWFRRNKTTFEAAYKTFSPKLMRLMA